MAFTTTIATPKPVAAGHVAGRVGRQTSFANRVQKWEPRYTSLAARNVVVRAGDATSTGAGAVNDDTWEELVLKSSVPVLVDFWAPWCGPCRMIAPIIDEIAQEYGDKLKAVKLNTDESPQVATEYGIRSIPTVMVFKDGQKMDAVIGAVPKSTLVQTIEKYMN
ncbi:hypothetical protein M9435_006258 [Picochlorum sp. BPE23]|nr:hypothetical protein M9435_006258 [Picochlorum sp. BPE23]WPT18329.1 Thioredoxin M-type [Picochlorum sp. SENEW3]|mmetsp:Transcript_4533/g.9015  ORF Transcript_4533/g.9015 Transcript_4533/m.9015 type:complete len:164 (+) Transcript_4533:76-567(+)